MNCCGDRYNKVCLVLDDDIANQICTDSKTGFSNQTSDWITWRLNSNNADPLNNPSKIAQKIELYFRDTQHAQIADFFIEYKGEIKL